MSENKHVQYRFDANFHVTKFVFWQPKVIEGNDIVKEPVEKHIPYENLITSPDQTINFYEMVAMKFSGLSSYEYLDPIYNPQTTEIYFVFNKQIDPSSIDDNTFYCEDLTSTSILNGKRRDGKPQTKYIFNPSLTPSNSGFTNGDQTLWLRLSDNRNSNFLSDIPHMSNFSVTLNFANIRSIHNEALSTNSSTKIGLLMTTEFPSLVVKSKKITCDFGADLPLPFPFEMSFYSHVWASIGYQNYIIDLTDLSTINSIGGTQYPYPNEYSTYQWRGNRYLLLWEQERMLFYLHRLNSMDMLASGFHLTLTHDVNDAYKKYEELASGMVTTLVSIIAPEWIISKELAKFIDLWNIIGWWDDLFYDKDQTIGKGDLTQPQTINSLWGTGQLYKPKTIIINTENAILELEFTIIGQ